MDQLNTQKKTLNLILVKYRDSYCNDYDYFWTEESTHHIISPFFTSEKDANDWLTNTLP